MSEPGNTTGQEPASAASERSIWFGVVGAIIGGVAGYFAFFAILRHASIYALVLPGVFIGLGRAIGAQKVSIPLGIACGIAALILSIAIEWRIAAHPEGETILHFITHLHQRPFRDFASIIAGPLIALWFGVGRRTAQ